MTSQQPAKSRSVNNQQRLRRSLFFPLALLAITVLGSLVSDIYQLYRSHAVLTERNSKLDLSVRESRNVRDQFEVLVNGVAQLAEKGNQNAALILKNLQRAGVEVDANPPG